MENSIRNAIKKFHGKFHGISWNFMESHGIWWNFMKIFNGMSWNKFHEKKSVKCL
jgi:hypothetical protein